MVDATALEENSHRIPTILGHQPEGLFRAVTVPAVEVEAATPLVTAMLVVEAAAAGAPHTELAVELAAEAITEAEAT
jgi:hypothetical protein